MLSAELEVVQTAVYKHNFKASKFRESFRLATSGVDYINVCLVGWNIGTTDWSPRMSVT